jgi:hypothetical protein
MIFWNRGKRLPHPLIKKKRMPSLLMEIRVKIIKTPLSGAHKKLYSHLSKEGIVEITHRRHCHHFSLRKQHHQPRNSEQRTLTLPITIVEPTNTVEVVQSHMKIHAWTQPPARRQRSSDCEEELRRRTRQGGHYGRSPNGSPVTNHRTSSGPSTIASTSNPRTRPRIMNLKYVEAEAIWLKLMPS